MRQGNRGARTAAFFVVALLALDGSRAGAQSPDSVMAAEALFNEGNALNDAGKLAEGCPKLAESHRLDPQAGVAFFLADCEQRLGKTGSAWVHFREAETRWRQRSDKRTDDAKKRADALEKDLAKVTIQVSPLARVPGLVVKRNGVEVGEAQWGSSVPVDPGPVTIEASAPNRETWRSEVRAVAGTLAVEVPALAAAKGQALPPSASSVPVPITPQPDQSPWSTARIGAVGLAGIGVIGVAVGAGFGVDTLSKTAAAKEHCLGTSPDRCDADGLRLLSDSKSTALASDIGLVVGAVAIAAGVVLFVAAPPGAKKTSTVRAGASVGQNAGGLWFRGEW